MTILQSSSHALSTAITILVFVVLGANAGLDDYNDAEYFDQFNPPPADFNTDPSLVGFDSNGDTNYNAFQIHDETIEVEETPLYDNFGNQLEEDGVLVITKAEKVGYYGDDEHFGKIHAGAWAEIEIDGNVEDCLYLSAVDVQHGGSYSGWVRADKMSPSSDLLEHTLDTYDRRENVRYTKNPDNSYTKMTIIDQSVPEEMEDGYIIPDRTGDAGKVKYYYIRDGNLNGFINIPETGNKRHGVQASRVKVGGSFWRDNDVEFYEQSIYAYDSSEVVGTFNFVFGYFETNTGQRIYTWTNLDCLEE